MLRALGQDKSSGSGRIKVCGSQGRVWLTSMHSWGASRKRKVDGGVRLWIGFLPVGDRSQPHRGEGELGR